MQIKKCWEFMRYRRCMPSNPSFPSSLNSSVDALEQSCASPALQRVRCLIILTKPRLAFFSLLSAACGYAASVDRFEWILFGSAMVGTAAAAGGALSLNHWWERRSDAWMRRTRTRPLPSGQLAAPVALAWSLLLSMFGVALLGGVFGAMSAALAATTILLYGCVYTPLKRRTRWATEVGSISGALPPLIGSAAAGNVFSQPAIILFVLLVFWQMPHFFAIGWMHREDYRKAGFPLLPAVDVSGRSVAYWSLAYSVLLLFTPWIAWLSGACGPVFVIIATLGAVSMIYQSARMGFCDNRSKNVARRLFLATLFYLPPVMMALWVENLFRGQ